MIVKQNPEKDCDIYDMCGGEAALDCYNRGQPSLSQCKECLCSICSKNKCITQRRGI